MITELDIRIGFGLSKLDFGATMSEVETIIGKPNKTEQINNNEDFPTEVWHYNDLGLSLFFDVANTNLLICADIENPDATLWGKKIFELNEKQIIELFKVKGMFLYDSEKHEWGEKRISYDEANIDFYFANNRLISINYGIITEGSQTLILPN